MTAADKRSAELIARAAALPDRLAVLLCCVVIVLIATGTLQ